MKKGFLAVMVVALLTSCAVRINGNSSNIPPAENATAAVKAAEEAVAKGFTGIEINGGFDVYYTEGKTPGIKLKGNSESIRHTIVKNENNVLSISAAKGMGNLTSDECDVDIYVTAPSLSDVAVKGSGDFISNGEINAKRFTVCVAGSGDIDLSKVTSSSMNVDVVGSGDVNVGYMTARSAEFSIAGSGDVDVKNIKADNVTASIAGSGDVNMERVDIQNASCTIAGSGDIVLKGRVGKVDKSVAGSGTVTVNRQ